MRTPNKLQSFDNHQRKDKSNALTPDSTWKSLYRIGGAAALIAGVIFRRNIGAEIFLFSGQVPPSTVTDWFTLLQNNRLVGLSLLNVFDVVNYALLGLMFLALYATLRQTNKSYMTISTTFGLAGVTVYFASNTAFSMLSLSNQYVTATTEAHKSLFLAAGQSMLVGQGTGIYKFAPPSRCWFPNLSCHATKQHLRQGNSLRGNSGKRVRFGLLYHFCFRARARCLPFVCRGFSFDDMAYPCWSKTLPARTCTTKRWGV